MGRKQLHIVSKDRSAKPREAVDLGLVPSAGALNRNVLTPPGTYLSDREKSQSWEGP